MNPRFAAFALMLGNLVVGLCVVGPTGMLRDLAAGLGVSIIDAGLLITYGAVVLCFGSPLMSWLTSRMDRRTLLCGSVAIMALANLASAVAPDYAALLVIRVVMLAAAAPFTPQAASTIALIVPGDRRSSAIAFVFLGWSLSIALGLPLIGFLAATFGWRTAFAVLGVAGFVSGVLLYAGLPGKLYGAAVSLKSWAAIFGNRRILLLLGATALSVAGAFATFTYLGPLLVNLIGATTTTIGIFFVVFGVAGFVGNLVATRIVGDFGALATTFIFLTLTGIGALLWSLGAGSFPVMIAGALVWGLGFASINSMQQARLIAAAPALAGGSVALNTSAIYVGQAIGSGIGSVLFGRGLFLAFGYLAVAFLVATAIILALTRGPSETFWRPRRTAGE